MRRLGVWFALAALYAFAMWSCLAVLSCGPRGVEAFGRAIPPVVEASCVLVRAFLNDGTAEEICATAEDLAPFVPELLSAREQPAQKEAAARVVMAAALPAPTRKLPRRRCVEWQTVSLVRDGGKEGGADGSGTDASDRKAPSAN